jgi:hypothetical protein
MCVPCEPPTLLHLGSRNRGPEPRSVRDGYLDVLPKG